jgi:hypothetical protein
MKRQKKKQRRSNSIENYSINTYKIAEALQTNQAQQQLLLDILRNKQSKK